MHSGAPGSSLAPGPSSSTQGHAHTHIRTPSSSSFLHSNLHHHSTTNSSSTTSPVSQTTVLLRTNANSQPSPGVPGEGQAFYGSSLSQVSSTVVQTAQGSQTGSTGVNKGSSSGQGYIHPIQHNVVQNAPPGHSFLSAVSEVRNMENALLGLLAAFNSGELSAFGSGRTLETMEAIRAKQERLARLHFDLASGINTDDIGVKDPAQQQSPSNASQQQQQQSTPSNLKPQDAKNTASNGNAGNGNTNQETSTQTSSGPWMSESDQNKLVAGLRELSIEIEKLHEHESSVKRGREGVTLDVKT